MTTKQQYQLRLGNHNIEREVSQLFEDCFPEYEKFYGEYLIPLTDGTNWRNDTLEYLEFIGMACFGLMSSINFINKNKNCIKRGDADQRFKNIYFHFGLVSDCVDNLSRNIALTSDYLGIDKIDRKPKEQNQLIKSYKTWINKSYNKNLKDLYEKGKQITHHPHSINFYNYSTSNNTRKILRKFFDSIKKYRNFYTHNPGVAIIQKGQNLYVVKRSDIDKARSWSNLKIMIGRSLDSFVNPHEQITKDLHELFNHLRKLWNEFDEKMTQIVQHQDYGNIFLGYNRNHY